MIFIKNKNTDVYFNLAMEEYFFEKFKKDEVFMLWINEPSVVIGKHQNLIEELNMKYCFENFRWWDSCSRFWESKLYLHN